MNGMVLSDVVIEPDGKSLRHVNDVPVVRLRINGMGNYVLIGRVVIENQDDDDQDATAAITKNDNDVAHAIDKARVRIRGGYGRVAVALQAVVTIDKGQTDVIFDIKCNTNKGFATQASLCAFDAGELAHFDL